jgi:hypothetical protein
MSDTPITDKVRAAIKEARTSRTDGMRGERLALVELERLERERDEARAECERLLSAPKEAVVLLRVHVDPRQMDGHCLNLRDCEEMHSIYAALDAARGTSTTPAGYVLVPQEPTKDMKDTFIGTLYDLGFESAYRDMLAAAKEK